MIERKNPDVGYIGEDVFGSLHFVQAIRAGNVLYLSGTAPYRGSLERLELVGEDDLETQVDWTLQILERCLRAYGATFRNWVAQTVYTTDIEGLGRVTPVFGRYFGEHVPTSTWVEVRRLFGPKQLVEISGIAVLDG